MRNGVTLFMGTSSSVRVTIVLPNAHYAAVSGDREIRRDPRAHGRSAAPVRALLELDLPDPHLKLDLLRCPNMRDVLGVPADIHPRSINNVRVLLGIVRIRISHMPVLPTVEVHVPTMRLAETLHYPMLLNSVNQQRVVRPFAALLGRVLMRIRSSLGPGELPFGPTNGGGQC